MLSIPCCVALLCGSSLLVPPVQAARTNHGGQAVATHEADTADAATAAAQAAADDAIALARTFYVQARVSGCLETAGRGPLAMVRRAWHTMGLNRGDKRLTQDLVQTVWAIELNQTTRNILKDPFFSSIRGGLFKVFAKEIGDDEALLEESKLTLKTQHNFDYDAVKRKCMADVEGLLNRTEDMMEEELSGACTGGCSKLSRFSKKECHEATEAKVCPEGTECGCHFQIHENLGALVSAMTGVGYMVSSEAVLGAVTVGAGVNAVGVGVLAAALAATHAKGCRCLPSPCAWDRERGACAPAPAAGARNPFQAVLPYVGTKCVATPPADWRSHFSLDPACEEAQPCGLADSKKIGQLGNDTYNCKYMDAPGKSATLFPPLAERLATYERLFPGVSPGV